MSCAAVTAPRRAPGNDRQARFRREIKDAIAVGVKPSDVAVVIEALAGGPCDPDDLRAALMQYAPPPPRAADEPPWRPPERRARD